MKAVGLDISIQSYAPAPDDAARSSAIDDLTSGPFPAPVDALAIQGSALSGAAAAAAAARSIAAGVPVIVFDTETTGAPGAFASVVVDGDAVARMMKDAGARDGASLAHLAELSDNRAMLVIDRRPYDQGRRCVELMVAKNQGQTVSAREALAPVAVTFRTLQRYLADMKGKGIAPENGAPWPAPPGPGSGSAPGAANPAAPRR